MTAQILVGHTDPYHGGIYPTHMLWLSENSRPAWLLEPTGRAVWGVPVNELEESPAWTKERTTWVPSGPDHILEDGILLIAVHVLRDEAVLELVGERCPVLTELRVPFQDMPVDLTRLPHDVLAELRHRCAQIDLEYKLVLTVLSESSVEAQLPVLERYPMQLEVCTVGYLRAWGGFVARSDARVEGSLTPRPGAQHRYRDVNL